jgi:hypothetical protein
MEDFTPPTEPSGALTPPPKPPVTAIATASPAPIPPRPQRLAVTRPRTLRAYVNNTLDAIDEIADALAEGLGLRRK